MTNTINAHVYAVRPSSSGRHIVMRGEAAIATVVFETNPAISGYLFWAPNGDGHIFWSLQAQELHEIGDLVDGTHQLARDRITTLIRRGYLVRIVPGLLHEFAQQTDTFAVTVIGADGREAASVSGLTEAEVDTKITELVTEIRSAGIHRPVIYPPMTTIAAQDVLPGQQVWRTLPGYESAYTLARVIVMDRDDAFADIRVANETARAHDEPLHQIEHDTTSTNEDLVVCWHYRNGTRRWFAYGTKVAVDIQQR